MTQHDQKTFEEVMFQAIKSAGPEHLREEEIHNITKDMWTHLQSGQLKMGEMDNLIINNVNDDDNAPLIDHDHAADMLEAIEAQINADNGFSVEGGVVSFGATPGTQTILNSSGTKKIKTKKAKIK